jgi:hypothetical protein
VCIVYILEGKATMLGGRLPRADSFLYCITLRLGVYFIVSLDMWVSVFETGLLIFILLFPEYFLPKTAGEGATEAWTGEPTSRRSGQLAFAMISAFTVYLASSAVFAIRYKCSVLQDARDSSHCHGTRLERDPSDTACFHTS